MGGGREEGNLPTTSVTPAASLRRAAPAVGTVGALSVRTWSADHARRPPACALCASAHGIRCARYRETRGREASQAARLMHAILLIDVRASWSSWTLLELALGESGAARQRQEADMNIASHAMI
jgi:hypothetical protein